MLLDKWPHNMRDGESDRFHIAFGSVGPRRLSPPGRALAPPLAPGPLSMTDDVRLGLRDVLNLLREDIRLAGERYNDELAATEKRISADLESIRQASLTYQANHLEVHNRRAADTDALHKELAAKLQSQVVVEARRAGALAVGLLIIQTIGRNWQAIAVLLGLLGLLLGRIDVNVMGPVQ